VAGAGVLFEDRSGFGRPNEGLKLSVAFGDPGVNGGFEISDALEDPAPYALAGDLGEQPLDQIDPG
jgi:hypothetical protein